MKRFFINIPKIGKIAFFGIVASLFFLTYANGQNVGITDAASLTPQSLLHIYKNSAGPHTLLQLANSTVGSGAGVGLTFDADASFNLSINNRAATSLGFNTSGIQRMVIVSDGRVGINVTPSVNTQKLQVNGAATVEAILGYYDATRYGIVGAANSGVYGTSNQTSGAGVFGDGSTVTDGIYGQTNVAASSVFAGVDGYNSNATGAGVWGFGGAAASASYINGSGVIGNGTVGVMGANPSVSGVYGYLGDSYTGVYGVSNTSSGAGVWGAGGTATNAFYGTNNCATTGMSTIYVVNIADAGDGIIALGGNTASYSSSAGGDGVSGSSDGSGIGVVGYNSSTTGNAILGLGGANLSFASSGNGDGVIGATDGTGFGTVGVHWNGANSNRWGYIGSSLNGVYGTTDAAGGFGVYGYQNIANETGAGVFGYAIADAGTAFGLTTTRGAVKGQVTTAGSYSFGIIGTGGTSTRSGGVIGLNYGINGALGYYAFSGSNYSVYGFGTAYFAGIATGKTLSTDSLGIDNNIGLGIYGGTMGGWVRGLKYGTLLKGDQFGLYVSGKTYTNNFIVQLDNSQDQTERIPSYVTTSTSVDIIDKGVSKLEDGKAFVRFDKSFSKIVSLEIPITITATPNGKSTGIYIESVTNEGFTVVENNGNSDVQFTWIAIGTKAGYERPENSSELLTTDFDRIMDGVMHNDADTTGQGTPLWWDGTQMRFDTPPESLTHKDEIGLQTEVPSIKPQNTLLNYTKDNIRTNNILEQKSEKIIKKF
jgi:hypothetical protein